MLTKQRAEEKLEALKQEERKLFANYNAVFGAIQLLEELLQEADPSSSQEESVS